MKILRWLLIGIILVSLIVYIRATDMQQVMSSVGQVGYRFGVLIGVTFFSALLATIGWRFCFGAAGKSLSLRDMFFVRLVGETVGIVNPASALGGDAVKAVLLRDKELPTKTVLASLLISRVIMTITQISMFFLALLALYFQDGMVLHWPHAPMGLIIAILCSIPVIYWLMRHSWFRDFIRPTPFGARLARRTAKMRQKMGELRLEITSFYRNNKKDLLWSALFFAAHWFFGALEFYFILLFLGVDATVMQALLVDMGVIFFKSAGAFIPGQIGVEEYGNKVMLATIGAPGTEIWVTASILRRTRQLFWIVAGMLTYVVLFRKWNFRGVFK